MKMFWKKIMKFGKKLAMLSKNNLNNSEPVHNKKHKETENNSTQKKVILIDSVYRKDENYYLKLFLEKI